MESREQYNVDNKNSNPLVPICYLVILYVVGNYIAFQLNIIKNKFWTSLEEFQLNQDATESTYVKEFMHYLVEITFGVNRRCVESNRTRDVRAKSRMPASWNNKTNGNMTNRNDIDKKLNSLSISRSSSTGVFASNLNRLTKEVALDCEMVGVGDGTRNMLARVSLVNSHGDCIYDAYVKPQEQVTDYRTAVSGIRARDIVNGEDFAVVQREVRNILRGRILIGHAIHHDMNVLFTSHPPHLIRDTARYPPFRKIANGHTPSLQRLAKEVLGIKIQRGQHNSVEDARAAMQLYMTYRTHWEKKMQSKR